MGQMDDIEIMGYKVEYLFVDWFIGLTFLIFFPKL